MPKLPRNRHLTVKVIGDQLVISIGVSTLAFAVQRADDWTGAITNDKGFAKDLARELEEEDEVGQTTVHRILDEAANRAVEGGSQHFDLAAVDQD